MSATSTATHHARPPRGCPPARVWSDEETIRLFELRAAGMSFAAISRELGRRREACRQRIYMVEGREARRLRALGEAAEAMAQRRCLCGCGRLFASTGPHERISPACRDSWSRRA